MDAKTMNILNDSYYVNKDQRTKVSHLVRSEFFDVELVKEFGEKRIRMRVYRVLNAQEKGFKGDCFVVDTFYDHWGDHDYDQMRRLADGPLASEEVALRVAGNLQLAKEKDWERRHVDAPE